MTDHLAKLSELAGHRSLVLTETEQLRHEVARLGVELSLAQVAMKVAGDTLREERKMYDAEAHALKCERVDLLRQVAELKRRIDSYLDAELARTQATGVLR